MIINLKVLLKMMAMDGWISWCAVECNFAIKLKSLLSRFFGRKPFVRLQEEKSQDESRCHVPVQD